MSKPVNGCLEHKTESAIDRLGHLWGTGGEDKVLKAHVMAGCEVCGARVMKIVNGDFKDAVTKASELAGVVVSV